MLARVRRILHVLVAGAFYYSGILGLLQFFRRRLLHENGTYVLGFHRILAESEKGHSDSLPGMILGESTFVELIDYLQKRMQFITLETFLQDGAGAHAGDKPRCLVTFDDAWTDTGARAAPLLKQRAMSAIVFVPVELVGQQEGFWIEQFVNAWKDPSSRTCLAPLVNRVSVAKGKVRGLEEVVQWLLHMPARDRQSFLEEVLPPNCHNAKGNLDSIMSWEQLARIKDQGIEIGGHTLTHPLLTYEDDETVDRELRRGKQILEQQLGIPVRAFAYPNGDQDRRVRGQVIAAGYACAFTTAPGCYGRNHDKFEIPRFLLHDGNVTGLRGKFSRAMLNMTLAGWA